VASTSSGQCWSLTTYCPVPGPVLGSPANNGYQPGFAAAPMLKELALSQAAAEASGAASRPGRRRPGCLRIIVLRVPGSGAPAAYDESLYQSDRDGHSPA
jgi:hypothetical protein